MADELELLRNKIQELEQQLNDAKSKIEELQNYIDNITSKEQLDE